MPMVTVSQNKDNIARRSQAVVGGHEDVVGVQAVAPDGSKRRFHKESMLSVAVDREASNKDQKLLLRVHLEKA